MPPSLNLASWPPHAWPRLTHPALPHNTVLFSMLSLLYPALPGPPAPCTAPPAHTHTPPPTPPHPNVICPSMAFFLCHNSTPHPRFARIQNGPRTTSRPPPTHAPPTHLPPTFHPPPTHLPATSQQLRPRPARLIPCKECPASPPAPSHLPRSHRPATFRPPPSSVSSQAWLELGLGYG